MMLDKLMKIVRLSLLHPRAGMRTVLNWRLSKPDAWLALALTAVVSGGFMSLLVGKLPPEIDPVSAAFLSSPILLVLVQGAGLAMGALFLFLLGRVSGGTGTLPEAVVTMAWLEVVLLCIAIVQVVGVMLLPPLGLLLFVACTIYSLWLVTHFVAELHGYTSHLLTLLGVVAAFFIAAIATGVVMVLVVFLMFLVGILHV